MTGHERSIPGLEALPFEDATNRTFRHVSSPNYRLSTSVVLAVAESLDVEPEAIDPPLAEVINPDALDGLVGRPPAGADADLEVAFTLAGCRVTVDASGRINVVVEAGGSVGAGPVASDLGAGPVDDVVAEFRR